MKRKIDYKYLKICLYIIITVIIIYLAIMVINSVPVIYRTVVSFLAFVLQLLKPLVIGLVIAYILKGPTNGIEHFLGSRKRFLMKSKKMHRVIGIVVSYLLVIGILTLIIWGIYFMIGGQLSQNTTLANILSSISYYFENHTITASGIQKQINSLNIPFLDNLDSYISEAVVWLQDYFAAIMNSFFKALINIGSNLFTIFLAFVLSIYLIYDAEYFKLLWKKFFFMIFRKSKLGEDIRRAFAIINTTFSGYIKGQLIEAFLVAILSTIALLIIDINYALLIGIISGICNLIPYIGPLVGTVLAATIGLLDGGIWKLVFAIVAMIIVQQIDSNVLSPKIVGHNVGLHPLFILLAIIVGGSWGGLLGMLVAVPIVASLKKLCALWYAHNVEEQFNESERMKEAIKTDEKL